MTPQRLLQHFDRISDALDAIPRLRRFILDLAVRGKLVEQDPRDEPASELLKRIWEEKARLLKGSEKTTAQMPELRDEDWPLEPPHGWCWARFGEIYSLEYGDNLPSEKRSNSGEYPVYGSNGIVGTHSVCFVREPCIVVGRKGSAGALNLSVTKGCCVTDVAYYCIPPHEIDLIFSFNLFHTLGLDMLGKGIKPGLNRNEVYVLPVAIPPLAEQHRIVAKVDELMALCDRLEAAQAERENRRDRLVASSLNRLNNGAEPDSFRDHARFYFNHLPRLTTKPGHIQQLRQTILNLAVRGKLVPQDSNDEPVAELLNRVQTGKTRKEKAGELKQQQSLAKTETIEPPFEIPDSWCWGRMDDCFAVGGGIQKTPDRIPKNHPYPYIGVANVYRGRLDLSVVKQFELFEGDLERFRLMNGDILVVEGNGSPNEIGRCAAWSGEISECVHQNHIIRCRPFILEFTPFVLQFLNSPNGIETMKSLAITSSGLYSLSVGKIRTIRFPIAPLAEQHRIVAKVDELLALCDKLEAQLTTAHTESRRLLEAVLHEALAPVV